MDIEITKLQLYSDLIKIGIPSLAGLLAGLIPFFIERKKSNALLQRDKFLSEKDNSLLLIEKISEFTKVVDVYIADMCHELSFDEYERFLAHKKAYDKNINHVGSNIKYARMLAISLDLSEVADKIQIYSKSFSGAVAALISKEPSKRINALEILRKSEDEMVNAMDIIAKKNL